MVMQAAGKWRAGVVVNRSVDKRGRYTFGESKAATVPSRHQLHGSRELDFMSQKFSPLRRRPLPEDIRARANQAFAGDLGALGIDVRDTRNGPVQTQQAAAQLERELTLQRGGPSSCRAAGEVTLDTGIAWRTDK